MKLKPSTKPRKTAFIGVRLTDETRERFETACETAGTTLSGGVEQLIENYLKGEQR